MGEDDNQPSVPAPGLATGSAAEGSWSRRKRAGGRLIVIAALTYVGVCVVLGLVQSKLIYFPTRDYAATPADVGLAFEDLTLRTRDGVAIAAWYIAHGEPRGSVIFFHGNAGNMSDRLPTIQALHRLGLSVLLVDYRGYGRSEGKPSEKGTYEDADAAWRYLVETRGESPDRTVLFGRSLGGAVAIELARRRNPAALVVESTFTNLLDIGRLHYPLLPVRLILTYRYDSLSKVPRITCPKLFIHGIDDTLIPFENGRRLYDAAAEPKQFLETPGGHNEGGFMYSPAFVERLHRFLAGVLPIPASPKTHE